MTKYQIEVDDKLDKLLKDNSKMLNISIERFITDILSRFVVDAHIMENEDVKNGYEECGEMNLQIAGL